MSQTDLHRISLCKHACKEVCDVKQGVDPHPLLARSCDRWWPDFVTFTACKRSIFGLKGGKKAQCISNRCKDWFKRKKYFGVMCTIRNRDQHELSEKGITNVVSDGLAIFWTTIANGIRLIISFSIAIQRFLPQNSCVLQNCTSSNHHSDFFWLHPNLWM